MSYATLKRGLKYTLYTITCLLAIQGKSLYIPRIHHLSSQGRQPFWIFFWFPGVGANGDHLVSPRNAWWISSGTVDAPPQWPISFHWTSCCDLSNKRTSSKLHMFFFFFGECISMSCTRANTWKWWTYLNTNAHFAIEHITSTIGTALLISNAIF